MREELIGSFSFSKRQQNSVGDATRAKGAYNTTRSVVLYAHYIKPVGDRRQQRPHRYALSPYRLPPRGISIAMDTPHCGAALCGVTSTACVMPLRGIECVGHPKSACIIYEHLRREQMQQGSRSEPLSVTPHDSVGLPHTHTLLPTAALGESDSHTQHDSAQRPSTD